MHSSGRVAVYLAVASLAGGLVLSCGGSSSGGNSDVVEDSTIDTEPLPDTDKPDAATDTVLDTKSDSTPGDPPDTVVPPGCTEIPLTSVTTNFFVDISDESGIRDENFVTNPINPIPINDHSRLGFVDINGDGFEDLVAHSLYPNPQKGIPFEHLVFVNNGDGTFTNFSDESGLRNIQAGFFAFGDVDNDGDQDCFAGLDIQLGTERHKILLNDGSGHFTVKENSGVDSLSYPPIAANAVFADFNNDAKLDLYVGTGHTSFAAQDLLFWGNGNGTFSPGTDKLIAGPSRPTNGTVACDYDNDGDMDIFVSTYGVSVELGHNVLWQNEGGVFYDVALQRGFATLATGNYFLEKTGYGKDAEPNKTLEQTVGSNGFGLDCGDVNNDGKMDVFLTTISHPVDSDYKRKWSDPTQLLIQQGPESEFLFKNEYLERGLPFNEGDVDGALVDFDNDGRLDLSMSRDKKYEKNYTDPQQKAWFGLMWQQADGSFKSVGVDSGINDPNQELKRMKNAQNHAWADIDHDGDLDLLVGGRDTGGGRPNFMFRNDLGSKNRWLAIHLVGDGVVVNRDAIGARVSVVFSDAVLTREVHASRGMHNSMDTRVQHFGLGAYGCDYQIKVRWPDGKTVVFEPGDIPENSSSRLIYPDAIEPGW
jgi:hypothetical protein